VSGPVTGGNGKPVLFAHAAFDLATVGYTAIGVLRHGHRQRVLADVALTSDGRWNVQPSSPAAYVTRIVVERPIIAGSSTDPSSSSGSMSREAVTQARPGPSCTTS